MGTVVQTFEPLAGYNTGSVIAELYVPSSGPTLTPGWAFTNPGTNLEICFPSQAINYGSGNATIQIDWYCLAATSGTATWKAKVIAVTPGDAESVEASDNATSTTSSATTVNGTAGGLTRTTISVSALDSMAAGDKIWIKLQRDTSDTSIAQTIYLTEMIFSYGDGLTGTPGSGDVVGPASATSGRVAVYNGVTGKLLQDGTKLEADLVTGPASVAATANVAVFSGTGGKVVADGGQTIAQILATAGDVDGPGSSTSGNVASFSGTTGKIIQDAGKLAGDLVTGPASATSGRIATFNGATGKIIQDGGVLGSDLIVGPASAVSGDILTFNGTTGKLAQDSGVAISALPARFNPGGADPMFTGTWSANDKPQWNGSAWVPKLDKTVVLTSAFTITSTSLADVTGLSITINRAGSFAFWVGGILSTATTTQAVQIALNFSGTLTTIGASGVWSTPTAGYFMYFAQTANNALSQNATTGTAATSTAQQLDFRGGFTVSTTGTITVRALRPTASGTTQLLAGTSFVVMEV